MVTDTKTQQRDNDCVAEDGTLNMNYNKCN